MKIKISLVQPNFQQGPKELNCYYLPYSVGVLWAYVSQFKEITDNFEIDQIIWKRDGLANVVEKLKSSDIVAFSTYIWNKNYNYALAKEIKKQNPNCLIIMGGPEPPITKLDIFKNLPFVDLVVKQEGEITFKKILDSYKTKDFKKIGGLVINDNLSAIDTGMPERIADLSLLPSPYLTGIFDDLIRQNPDVEWNATLETNRGCPFQCTFCDWGSLTYNKVKKFGLEKINAELEWIGKNKCGYVSIADANFGMFVERDNIISDKIIEVKEKYGFPYTFGVNWAKNQKNEVIGLVKKLSNAKLFAPGLTVSVQSLDETVLNNIKRKNLEISKIESIFQLCDKENIPVVTELILGLPGETVESWKNNFWRLFEAGNHTGVEIFQAQLLENAEMNLLQKKLFKLKEVTVYDYMSGSYNNDEMAEGVNAVISTSTLTTEQMLECQVFSWFINTFHIHGFSTYLARFYRKYQNLSYEIFYSKLFDYLKDDEWFKKEMQTIKEYYAKWMVGGRINHPPIAGVEIHGWNLIHRTLLTIHSEDKHREVFQKLTSFLRTIEKDERLIDDLIHFQKFHVVNYNILKQYPLKETFTFNILGYIQYDDSLYKTVRYEFVFPEDKTLNLAKFLELIYFGRRRGFGKTRINIL